MHLGVRFLSRLEHPPEILGAEARKPRAGPASYLTFDLCLSSRPQRRRRQQSELTFPSPLLNGKPPFRLMQSCLCWMVCQHAPWWRRTKANFQGALGCRSASVCSVRHLPDVAVKSIRLQTGADEVAAGRRCVCSLRFSRMLEGMDRRVPADQGRSGCERAREGGGEKKNRW